MNKIEKSLEFIKPKITFGNTLKFTAYSWSKLLWMRDRGNTEVAGYCVTGTEDPLLVTDFILIKQECTSVTFDLDPEDGVIYVEQMMDTGLPPWTFSNILAHTHPPGCSPNPSGVDEANFKKAFSHPDWAIMLIVADNGDSYCRLKLNVGPGVEKLLKVQVDFGQSFSASNHLEWETEYKKKVTKKQFLITGKEKDIIWPLSETARPYKNTPPPGLGKLFQYQETEYKENVDYKDNETSELNCYWDTYGNANYYCEDNDTCYSYDPVNKKWYTEDMFDDQEHIQEIETPQKPWTAQIITWAEEHVNERDTLIEC